MYTLKNGNGIHSQTRLTIIFLFSLSPGITYIHILLMTASASWDIICLLCWTLVFGDFRLSLLWWESRRQLQVFAQEFGSEFHFHSLIEIWGIFSQLIFKIFTRLGNVYLNMCVCCRRGPTSPYSLSPRFYSLPIMTNKYCCCAEENSGPSLWNSYAKWQLECAGGMY